MQQGSRGKKTGAASAPRVAHRPQKPAQLKSKRPVVEVRKRKGSDLSEPDPRLVEALQQQAATDEILRVMASSPGDVQPVLYAVAERAARLCDALFAQVLLVEGDVLQPTAAYWADAGLRARHDHPDEAKRSWPLKRSFISGRAAFDCVTIHHADAVPLIDTEYPDSRAKQQELGWRAVLAVPLLRKGGAGGVIFMFRIEPRPFSPEQIGLVETFARQAAIAIDNARLFNDTKEALERQTATSEILRVISQSPRDTQPVFDTIVRSARALCDATLSGVFLLHGETLSLPAAEGMTQDELALFASGYPRKIGRDTVTGRAALDCHVVQTLDLINDPEYSSAPGSRVGARTVLGIPLMRDGKAIGAIGVWRREVKAFSEHQIALLRTFADQAVIAIENVRLFKELEARNRDLTEALEQRTATGEILRAIASSPTDIQPVLETLVRAAARFCNAPDVVILRLDGDVLRGAAGVGTFADLLRLGVGSIDALEIPLTRGSVAGRAVLDRRMLHIHDLAAEPEDEFPVGHALQRRFGHRTMIATPMLREGAPVGTISLHRMEVNSFSDKQVELLQTFADQAAIAIENVRLFNETKEALERQTATSEILRVISSSPTDVQPVFDTIAAAALKLCDAGSGNVFTFDGEWIWLASVATPSPEGADAIRSIYPRRPGRETGATRAIATRRVVVIEDVLKDPEYVGGARAISGGFRSILAVPLIREGLPIGAITVGRLEPGPFSDKHVALLQTFADQAVIAIENVRLFKELEASTRDLSRSVGELKALGEVGQAVSSTLDLETVLSTIVSRAAQLAGMDGGSIWEYDEAREEFHLRATDRLPDKLVEALRAAPIRKGEGVLGRLAVTSEPVQIPDIADERTYQSQLRQTIIQSGFRSVLAVPLLREDHLLGALAVNRASTGQFAADVIDLIKTFATQSALAIQNARLFREIEVKSRELEAASRHKSEFLANMSHELRTPLNAIIGFSEVLSERMFGEINEKQAEYIGDILQSGQHLLSLINDILDLSKIEAGRMELELSDFDLTGTIEQTVMLVRERAVRRGIKLGRMIDERLGSIRADERKVKQVLLNLLSNALKFTPEGGEIDVRAAVNDGLAEISVTDTGVGISPEDQEAIFEEFRQVGTTSKKVEGTGLGLAISRKFIELHGGKIWVTSQVGTGSTFGFTLPLQRLIV